MNVLGQHPRRFHMNWGFEHIDNICGVSLPFSTLWECINSILTRDFSFRCNCWGSDPPFHPARLYTSSYHLPYSESKENTEISSNQTV